jgi:hypothetical protein
MLVLVGCQGDNKMRELDKKYNVIYLSKGKKYLSEINFFTGEENILKTAQNISAPIYTVNDNLILIGGHHGGVKVFSKKEKNFIKVKKDISIYGYLKEHQLILGVTYEDKISKLALYDLNFEKKEFVVDHVSQFNTLVLDNNKFIFGVEEKWIRKDGSQGYSKYWLYDFRTKNKVLLKELSEKCEKIIEYRSKTKQLLCKKGEEYFLTDINTEYSEKVFDISKLIWVSHYDKAIDTIFGGERVGSWDYRKGFEQRNLFMYDFKTKKYKILKKNFWVIDID